MITRLEIEGFKSFGSPSQAVDLSPLTFIVGQNASGKSNLIDSLRFLQNTVRQDAEFACNDHGGVAEVRNKIQRKRNERRYLRIRIELDYRNRGARYIALRKKTTTGPPPIEILQFDYTLAIDLRTKSGIPLIVKEALSVPLRGAGKESEFALRRTENSVSIRDPSVPGGDAEKVVEIPEEEHSRPAVAVFYSWPAVVFRQIVQQWSFFDISPRVARGSYRETPDVSLGPAGENLAVVLHKLEARNGKNALERIVTSLRGVVPGFKSVDAKKVALEGSWSLRFAEERIKGAIGANAASDGTIRLLALMVIAQLGEQEGKLIAIEEPENGVHPHLCGHLIDIFRKTSERGQVLATTHNPAFLDHLEPEEVLLCGKQDGLTKVKRADQREELDAFRKHFSLGELWVQGTFDGMLDS